MTFDEVKAAYEALVQRYGWGQAPYHISELFEELRDEYKQRYAQSAIAEGRATYDAEQSWKPFKGRSFEKLVAHILTSAVSALGLKWTTDRTLESARLSEELSRVRRNVLVHYGKYSLIPDMDIIIYVPTTCEVVAAISCKVTLRERVAQTAYWKLKLRQDQVTKNIHVFFVTPDEDKDLIKKEPPHRNRIIIEYDTDGAYVLDNAVEESAKIKNFKRFVDDLKAIVQAM